MGWSGSLGAARVAGINFGRPWGDKGGRSGYQVRADLLGLDKRGTPPGRRGGIELRDLTIADSAPDLLTRTYYALVKGRGIFSAGRFCVKKITKTLRKRDESA